MDTTAFVKQLASNNRKVRDNALETVQKYLCTKSFKETKQIQFNKLWKGLYFAMWFSDRPRPQQRLANELAELHLLYFDERDNKSDVLTTNDKAFLKFSRAFWKVLSAEWLSIDRYRLDKFLLLVRRVLFNQLKYLQARKWDGTLVEAYINKVLKWSPLSGNPRVSNGIPLHVIDILLDEWERLLISEDEDTNEEVDLTPLVDQTPLADIINIFTELYLNTDNSKVLRKAIKENLFTDERLVRWEIDCGFPEKKSNIDEAHEETSEDPADEEAEEWHGF
ncbi:hypothetical protein HG535_0B02800 [Zygotorulaspora mrakii]|uniref:Ribosomal RNA-processing protein 1 n=1 Tax=Zygotorulaspora mrakii TaxID=42260 RepID=A0A7H9AY59_ZYGMR|nr:uncharacterized protein HG535_0B02800 [Zygotorulaspora mrakii]QLG71241.1 hypothetical protein HG535_0B02800 [Zygotorulaspora mrakii]